MGFLSGIGRGEERQTDREGGGERERGGGRERERERERERTFDGCFNVHILGLPLRQTPMVLLLMIRGFTVLRCRADLLGTNVLLLKCAGEICIRPTVQGNKCPAKGVMNSPAT